MTLTITKKCEICINGIIKPEHTSLRAVTGETFSEVCPNCNGDGYVTWTVKGVVNYERKDSNRTNNTGV